MNLIAAGGVLSGIGAAALAAVVLWLLGRGGDDGPGRGDGPGDPHDPDAPDQDGFIPADKYGYGYGYSWGDPYGDPDL